MDPAILHRLHPFPLRFSLQKHYYTRTFHNRVVPTSESNFSLGSKLSAVILIAITVGI